MTNDTLLAIMNGTHEVAATAVGKLGAEDQNAILGSGGQVVLKQGKSPNGMDCTVVARFANGKCTGYFAVAKDGREQSVAVKQIDAVLSMVN